ncbi:DUF4381 domain-containing protein [Planctomycetaceae bacterium SH139]
MNSDPASLENLRDIAQPPPVSWWPPALGWWVLLAAIVIAAGFVALRGWRRRKARAYRRAAVRELESAQSIAEIAALLKRTALAAYPRSEIASLSGKTWCQWLQETGGQPVPKAVAKVFSEGIFTKSAAENAQEEVSAFVRVWIQNHPSPPPR